VKIGGQEISLKKILLAGSPILIVALFLFGWKAEPVWGMTVSPSRLEISGEPGQTLEGEILLLNEQLETKTFYTTFENFEAQGESGTPNFLPGSEGLASWLSGEEQVILNTNEQKKYFFKIKIPANAEPGGHFAAIFWGTSPPVQTGSAQVSVGAKIGALILLKVAGEVKEGGGLLEFGAKEGQRIFSSLPITFMYRLQNDGSDRLKPAGAVVVRSIFGWKTKELNANKSEGNVLPHSIRRFEITWENNNEEPKENTAEVIKRDDSRGFFKMVGKQWENWALGWYRVKLDLKYGADKTAEEAYHFFVFPWQLLSLIIIVLAIIGYLARRAIKKYNQWIIKQAKKAGI